MENIKYFTVCSSHMDREWYASYEETRIYTDAIINRVLDRLSKYPEYVYMLDGQTSVLEDFLEIYPEREEEIAKFVREERLLIGPWFIQPDECIPAGESMVRNLLLGERISTRYGTPMKVGYVPDTFGHISQLPQIFKQFAIPHVFLMRGCPEGTPRDFIWSGADGSRVLVIRYPYGTGGQMDGSNMRHGIRQDQTREEFQKSLEAIDRFTDFPAIAPYKLVAISGDMLPPPKRLEEFGISSFDRLSDCFAENEKVQDQLPVMTGELREGYDVIYNLQDTVATRIYLKQENQKAQNALMQFAEPLCALAFGATEQYPAGFMDRAWRYLLENHTHDGICGCSNDDVHREMMTRFRKSLNISETYTKIALQTLAASVDTDFVVPSDMGNHWDTADYAALVVYNPHPYPTEDTVRVKILYPSDKAPTALRISDSEGNDCPCQILNVHEREFIRSDFESVQHFAKDTVYEVALQTGTLPPFGVKAYRLDKASAASDASSALTVSEETRTVENKWIRLTVEENGTLTLNDKASGRIYRDLNYFAEEGDGGDTYAFRPIPDSVSHDSRDLKWEISFVQKGPVAAVCRLQADWMLPAEMTGRGTGRSEEAVRNSLEYELTVYADSPVIHICLDMKNRSKDHRIRACFPTQIQTNHVWADAQFSLEKRDAFREIQRGNTQPQQTFSAVCDDAHGMAVFVKGLHQYEYLDDSNGTLAVTLLRGQGVLYRVFFERYNEEFSECQCIGDYRMEYALCPFVPEVGTPVPDAVLRRAALFNSGIAEVQTSAHGGTIAPVSGFMEVEKGGLLLSSVKISEDRKRILARFYNPRAEKTQVQLRLALSADCVVRMNLHEDVLETLPITDGRVTFEAGPCEIITLGFDGPFSPMI